MTDFPQKQVVSIKQRFHLSYYELAVFETLIMLSPERGESTASLHVPTTIDADNESSLPDLIIEEQRYEHEVEPEDFYNELEIKMKQLYEALFLQKDKITEDFLNKTVSNYSDDEAFSEESDDVILRADPSGDDDDIMTYTKYGEDDENQEESAGADQAMQATSESQKVKFNKSREEYNVTDSEASCATSSESAERYDLLQEKLAKIKGKISFEENKDVNVSISQTCTQKPGLSDDPSSTETLNEGGTTVTFEALLHKEKSVHDRELEVMRRQTMYSIQDSFTSLRESTNGDGLDFNTRRCSREKERTELDLILGRYSIASEKSNPIQSTINTSVPMEIDSIALPSRVSSPFKRLFKRNSWPSKVSPTRTSSPFQEISPVLTCKRPASALPNIVTKKKCMGQKEQMNSQTETHTSVASKAIGIVKEIRVNILKPLSVTNREVQTDFQSQNAAESQSTNHADAGTQTPEEPEHTHRATQTERAETNDAETQTTVGFRHYRLFEGMRLNFFF